VRNEEVLQRVKERGMSYIKRVKDKWTCHVVLRNCLLKHFSDGKIEGRIEVKGRRGRRRQQLLDFLKERGKTWRLKEEAFYCTVRRTVCGQRDNLVRVKMMTIMMMMTGVMNATRYYFCNMDFTVH
jgi:hypothetical protein